MEDLMEGLILTSQPHGCQQLVQLGLHLRVQLFLLLPKLSTASKHYVLEIYLYSIGTHYWNLFKVLVTMSRVTSFTVWAHIGNSVSNN